ncbi:hypothetical protein MARA_29930 [Mycolicibacterium arabiense]|uniref:Uncharacterized protein n=1 Tax=Mycolicibacterium arabiense TaxID=1286181 RepID=A0A7I7S0R9_9MYCO|nr:hypothetical protein [Mycolicibacterium arabiense]MCV7374271.1 hypothetical protein [Mycolicibacterium arabiense]BBY49525.1 hypothetical protein MARA_29930 [Mycolicibacterium arabiense]
MATTTSPQVGKAANALWYALAALAVIALAGFIVLAVLIVKGNGVDRIPAQPTTPSPTLQQPPPPMGPGMAPPAGGAPAPGAVPAPGQAPGIAPGPAPRQPATAPTPAPAPPG